MAKVQAVYSCQGCGYQSPKWLGRCPDCGSWGSLIEEKATAGGSGWVPAAMGIAAAVPIPIETVNSGHEARFSSGLVEFDRVLGGGIVPGAVVLVGGDPGIGKSTLLLQAAGNIGLEGVTVLYVSGEESANQTKMRADRLGVQGKSLYVLTETCLEEIIRQILQLKPGCVVVDSVQTIYSGHVESAPGTVSQIRESSGQLIALAKKVGTALFVIGHVTKDGAIAGPRLLEHMVDTVLYFEGRRGDTFRILRAVKNRFGSTNEIGVFEMQGGGLQGVTNPSAIFLAERPTHAPGSAVVCTMEGTRPLLVEIQALVTTSNLAVPRRMVTGVEHNRVAMLAAVLEKRAGLHLQGSDIFVNVAGGVRVEEPAADLGIVLAIASSFKDRPIDPQTVVIGEVGLAGEVRAVAQLESRLREAGKLGFRRSITPSFKSLPQDGRETRVQIDPVRTVDEALRVLFT